MSLSAHPVLGRIGAISLLVLLAALFCLGPVRAYVGLVDSGAEQLDERAAVLQRYRALARQPTAPARSDPGSASLLLAGGAEAQAIAQLQEKVKTAAAASRVQVQSLQVLRSDTSGSAVRIGVRIRAAGDVASLARLLHAIEVARPVLFPDNLQIQARAAAGGAAAESLDFQLDVSALKPGAAS